MNRLGVERSKGETLMALVELGDDHCARGFADGVQMVTGCTLGKGNIRQLAYGKLALTLVDRTTGRAVRVVPNARPLAPGMTPSFHNYRVRGVSPSQVPDVVVDPVIDAVLSAPEQDLLSVGAVFHAPLVKAPESCESFVCERCGEMVAEQYGRIAGGLKVCVPCEKGLHAASIAAEQPQVMP